MKTFYSACKLTTTVLGCCYAVARVFIVPLTRCYGVARVLWLFSARGLIRLRFINSIETLSRR